MKKAHGVHTTWVVAPVAPMQELWKGGVEMCGGVFTFVLMGWLFAISEVNILRRGFLGIFLRTTK